MLAHFIVLYGISPLSGETACCMEGGYRFANELRVARSRCRLSQSGPRESSVGGVSTGLSVPEVSPDLP